MKLTMNELTVNFEHVDRERLVEDWRWLIGPTRQPILVTALGDVFLQDAHDGTVSFLDAAAGELSAIADDVDSFRQLLQDQTFVRDYFAVEAIADLRANGLAPSRGQVYSWTHPPVLGGEYEFANAEVSDIEIHFAITGQIHEQVSALPPGTPVDSIKFTPREGS
jgi:hypothetical protein